MTPQQLQEKGDEINRLIQKGNIQEIFRLDSANGNEEFKGNRALNPTINFPPFKQRTVKVNNGNYRLEGTNRHPHKKIEILNFQEEMNNYRPSSNHQPARRRLSSNRK